MSTENLPFDQSRLIDHLLGAKKLKNDAALSRVLSVAPPVISKMRHHRLAVGPAIKIRILEQFDMTVHQLNHLIGAPAA